MPIGIAAMGVLLLAARRAGAAVERSQVPGAQKAAPVPSPEIRSLIEREASTQGVPAAVALAFAELESGFNPAALGDRDWATKHPREWQETRRRLPENPAIDDPGAWASYGLFGLLAAYHAGPKEHPHVLLDPQTNATRGVGAIKHALERAHGDPDAARLLYVGCSRDGSHCSPSYGSRVVTRLRSALARWNATLSTSPLRRQPT